MLAGGFKAMPRYFFVKAKAFAGVAWRRYMSLSLRYKVCHGNRVLPLLTSSLFSA